MKIRGSGLGGVEVLLGSRRRIVDVVHGRRPMAVCDSRLQIQDSRFEISRAQATAAARVSAFSGTASRTLSRTSSGSIPSAWASKFKRTRCRRLGR